MNYKPALLNIADWLFGMLVVSIGLVNTFWGNDPGYGIFLLLLSLVYFPPVQKRISKAAGCSFPGLARIFLGIFIIWSALGVAELFDKLALMLQDLTW